MQNVLKYLSFRGRTNRRRYWETALLLVVLFVIAIMLMFGLTTIVPFVGILLLPAILALLAAVLANSVRRLHDRNKSAWWLLVFVVLPTLLTAPSRIAEFEHNQAAQAGAALLALLSLPFSIWAFVEMGCLKGTTGPNKYGDDPLQPLQEVFA